MANASSVLHKCPPVVRAGSPTLDTLYASAPFRGEASAIVEVPPVVDSGTVPVDSITKSSAQQPLTDTHGANKKDREKLVGWHTLAEQALDAMLRGRAAQILELIEAKQVHSALVPTATEAATAALADLDRIAVIYRKWRTSSIKANTEFFREGKGPIGLNVTLAYIQMWAGPVTDSNAGQYYIIFAPLRGGEAGGWNGGPPPPTANQFWASLLGARTRDRERIRKLFRRVLRLVWCGEYLVALSESFEGNKAAFAAKQITVPEGMKLEAVLVEDDGDIPHDFKLLATPVARPLVADVNGLEVDEVDVEEPEPAPVQQLVPGPVGAGVGAEVIVPTELAQPQAILWYQTSWARGLAIGVGALAVVGGVIVLSRRYPVRQNLFPGDRSNVGFPRVS